jgi:hypothetical protein
MMTSPAPVPALTTSGGRSTLTVEPDSGPSVSLTSPWPHFAAEGVVAGGVEFDADPSWSQLVGAIEVTRPSMKVTPLPAKLCVDGRPSPVGRRTHIPTAAAIAIVSTMSPRVQRIQSGVAGWWSSARERRV